MQSPANAFVSWNALPSTIRGSAFAARHSLRRARILVFKELFRMHLLDVALFDLLHQVGPMK